MQTTQMTKIGAVSGVNTEAPPVLSATAAHLESLRTEALTLAVTDSSFREALIREPRETLSALIGSNSEGSYTLSKGVEVIALEDSPTLINIVIPSADKAETATGELAELALALQSDPKLAADLMGSPRETLERFISSVRGSGLDLPQEVELKVIIEEPGQLVVAVPQASSEVAPLVAKSEFSEGERLEPRTTYECHTHGCYTATPSCMISSGCQSSGCFTSTWGCTGSC
jgi:hypothetical protein